MRTTIATEITIDATPEEVWATLTDLPRYCTWNTLIREAAGEVVPGTRLDLRTYPESGRPRSSRPRVLTVVPGVELRWVTRRFPVPGLLDGERYFRLSEGPGRTTRLEHGERFRGLLVPFLGKTLTGTARGLTTMNEALRARIRSARASS
ncbi:SRPBCC family protein [Streptomyces sp. NPDC101733]|uniref:SRPBCC family protein n=1 Tax=unclassified Streptomyces TaxID=2593676 RepID=UPI0037FD6F02